jgi:hypothetical protein
MAYQLNLVSGENLLPFNRMALRRDYTRIDENKAFFRGYLPESLPAHVSFPFMTTTAAGILSSGSPLVMVAVLLPSIATPFAIKSIFPVNDLYFREFDLTKIKDFSTKYIAYYDLNNIDYSNYPEKKIHHMESSYSKQQLDFMMRLADSSLTANELMSMTTGYSKEYLEVNSTRIQDSMKKNPGLGREIGNLIFENNKTKSYPDKFVNAYQIMMKAKGPIVIYSHYFKAGILNFKEYLEHMGQKGNYAILDPDLKSSEYERIVDQYNSGKIKFLLIHPEITEGLSLMGTSQMHILEPSYNQAEQDQIIGRVVRYKSHKHLPKTEQVVDVYIWKQVVGILDTNHIASLRKNWQENFSEFNYYGEKSSIDPNIGFKSTTPDETADGKRKRTGRENEALIEVTRKHSIESAYRE